MCMAREPQLRRDHRQVRNTRQGWNGDVPVVCVSSCTERFTSGSRRSSVRTASAKSRCRRRTLARWPQVGQHGIDGNRVGSQRTAGPDPDQTDLLPNRQRFSAAVRRRLRRRSGDPDTRLDVRCRVGQGRHHQGVERVRAGCDSPAARRTSGRWSRGDSCVLVARRRLAHTDHRVQEEGSQ